MKDREQRFRVSGMSCSACSARVERAVGKLAGVRSVQVNLLTGSMQVVYGAEQTEGSIIAAVEAAGYGATTESSNEERTTTPSNSAMRQRLVRSVLLLLPLMAIHHIWQGIYSALVQLVLTVAIILINRKFYISGTKSVLKGGANMDTLVMLGATSALADGIINMFIGHRGAYYFESAGMILTLITFGKWLESKATARTGQALEQLLELLPRTATIEVEGELKTIPADAVKQGDMLLVRAGDRIAVDGTVTNGSSAVDESALTGESLPAEKYEGCKVYAGSLNRHGVLHVRADKTRAQSALSDIITLVEQASATKAPIARIADRISAVFVPVVIGIATLACTVWMLLGAGAAFAVSCGIAVLVISCPCALGLATPVAIMVGTGRGAEKGILFRNGEAAEALSQADYIVLDKTGTLTEGKPHVTDICPAKGYTRQQLLQTASTLESVGNHPLAGAIAAAAKDYPPQPIQQHEYLPGRGVTATINGTRCAAGNLQLMRELGVNTGDAATDAVYNSGKTPIFIACGKEYIGMITVADQIKADSSHAVQGFRELGLNICMLTGDNPRTAQAIAKQAGIPEFHAEMLPQDKEQFIRDLQHRGHKVIMVGDGINDAPALMRANAGIAIGAGTDIAMESAGTILVRNELCDAVGAIRLSRAMVRNIRQNFFWALLYNTLAIPLAAGALYPLCGWQLHPAIAAAAMGMSSLCVVGNALRLRKFNPIPTKTMNTITINVDGMMCPHCEAHVTKAILAIPGVSACTASHKDKSVSVTCTADVPLSALHAAIQEQGYTVL